MRPVIDGRPNASKPQTDQLGSKPGRNAKPAAHERRDEPDLGNDNPWKPAWKKPGEGTRRGHQRALPAQARFPGPNCQFELAAVRATPMAPPAFKKRSPSRKKRPGANSPFSFRSGEGGREVFGIVDGTGTAWRSSKYKGPEPFRLVTGLGQQDGSPATSQPVARPRALRSDGVSEPSSRRTAAIFVSTLSRTAPRDRRLIAKLRARTMCWDKQPRSRRDPGSKHRQTLDGNPGAGRRRQSAAGGSRSIIGSEAPTAGDNSHRSHGAGGGQHSIGDGRSHSANGGAPAW